MIITIDGPAAAGKSTDAKLLAHRLKLYYVSSGMLYRALAYLFVTRESYTADTIFHPKESDIAYYADPQSLKYIYDTERGAILLFQGTDITASLKDPEMDIYTSRVAVHRSVRNAVNRLQKKIAEEHDVVIEGRDIGSAVFPHADVKFYITASPEVRAQRWQKMQVKRGNNVTQQCALHAVSSRDARDIERVVAPLVIPQDAHVIDTSDLNQEQALQAMLGIVDQTEKKLTV